MFKTLPNPDDEVSSIRLAVYSCANLPFGFFNAYGHAANMSSELDYVQHVGDYIYEYINGAYGDGTAIGRVPQPLRECATLDDYRDRFQSYRSDPDLQNLHAALAWQTVWDDHDVADQAYNNGTADSNNTIYGAIGGLEFNQRKAKYAAELAETARISLRACAVLYGHTSSGCRSARLTRTTNCESGEHFRLDLSSASSGCLSTSHHLNPITTDMIMLDTRNYNRSITDLYYNTDEMCVVVFA